MSDVRPPRSPFPILFIDDQVVVVDKPAGLESSGRDARDERSVQFRLAAALQRPLWALHQLDRSTSGVQVFALRRAAVARWQELFSTSAMRKYYWALVEGNCPYRGWQRVDLPLEDDPRAPRVRVAQPGSPGARPALTWVRALGGGQGHTWIEARLGTGRTHQVRVHLAHLGFPIVGDARYGASSRPQGLGPERVALHAARLHVTLPGGRHTFHAPLPADLAALSQVVGLPLPRLER